MLDDPFNHWIKELLPCCESQTQVYVSDEFYVINCTGTRNRSARSCPPWSETSEVKARESRIIVVHPLKLDVLFFSFQIRSLARAILRGITYGISHQH